jgi:hypothetical protein
VFAVIPAGIADVLEVLAGGVITGFGCWLQSRSSRAEALRVAGEARIRQAELKQALDASRQALETSQQEVQRLLSEANRIALEHIRVDVVPLSDDKGFFGRKREITEAANALRTEGTVVISGVSGVGKTQLALALYREISDSGHGFPDGVLWMPVGRSPNIEALTDVWCEALGLVRGNTTGLKAALERRSMLLIFDDVWDIEHVGAFLGGRRCGRLVTTHEWKRVVDQLQDRYRQPKRIALRSLTEEDALEVLKARAGLGWQAPDERMATFLSEHDAELRELCQLAGCIPITLAVMGAYLRDKLFASGEAVPNGDLRSLAGPLREAANRLDLPARKVAAGDDADQPTALREVLRLAIGDLGRDAADADLLPMMQTMSALLPSPDSFSVSDVCELFKPSTPSTMATPSGLTPADAKRQLDLLVTHCLVERIPGGATVADVRGAGAEHESDMSLSPPSAEDRYAVHELVGSFFVETIGEAAAGPLESLRERIAVHFRGKIEPSEEASPWEYAFRLESDEWHEHARQWIYQLRRLKDRGRARVAFDQVFFDTFWWWGTYLEEPRTGDLIATWSRTAPDVDEQDDDWLKAVRSFHREYKPIQRPWTDVLPTVPGPAEPTNWSLVAKALEAIIAADALSAEPTAGSRMDAAELHARAHALGILKIFLAEALWESDPTEEADPNLDSDPDADPRADPDADPQANLGADERYARRYARAGRLYSDAETLLGACDSGCCQWNLPWIRWCRAEAALKRGVLVEARDQANLGLSLALEQTGATPAEVLKNAEKDLSCEVMANCLRVRADATWGLRDRKAAMDDYTRACLFAYAFQDWPHRADDYTIAFYGEMIARTLDCLDTWYDIDPSEARDAEIRLVEFGRKCYPMTDESARKPLPPISTRKGPRRVELLNIAFAARPKSGDDYQTAPGKVKAEVERQINELFELVSSAASVGV